MNKKIKPVLISIGIIIVILAGGFKVSFINGRLYVENRWIHNYAFSSKKAYDHNTIIMVDSNCYNTGDLKISGYIDDEMVFDNDFIIGGEKNTDITVYRNLTSGEHDLVVKTENGLEAHEKIEIGKGQKWIYIIYEEDKSSKPQIIIKVIDRPGII
jgi:hypothetical protein